MVPNIPIYMTAGCLLDVKASSIGSAALVPLSFSFLGSSGSLVARAMFVSVVRSWGIVRIKSFNFTGT